VNSLEKTDLAFLGEFCSIGGRFVLLPSALSVVL
jgi:hypothetical protein